MPTAKYTRLQRRIEEDRQVANDLFKGRSPWEREAARQAFIHLDAALSALQTLRSRAESGHPQVSQPPLPEGMARPANGVAA